MMLQEIPARIDDPSVAELAWAAGFWDGEGCVYIDQRTCNVSLQVSQCGDEAVALLVRFARSVGIRARIYNGWRKHEDHKLAFKLHVRGEHARLAFDRCYPYLSETKRAQAGIAFERHAARKAAYIHPSAARTHCPQGHELSSGNTRRNSRGARVCLQCRRSQGLASYYRDHARNKERGRLVQQRLRDRRKASRVEVRQDEIAEEGSDGSRP
jgi:hypothetical protein